MSRPIHTDTRVLRPIIEALIFASEEPLAPRLLVRLLAGERDDPKSAAAESDEPEADATGPAIDAAPSEADQVDPASSTHDAFETGDVAADAHDAVEVEDAVEASTDVTADGVIAADDSAATSPAGIEDDADGMRLADGSESADALATAYVDLSRDYSERLFPEEQIVTIDQRLVRRLIDDLNAEYEETGRAFRIVEVAGGFQFATIREFGEYVALLSKEKQRRRLSPAALETLAIIAFRQPISKPEIEAIRGVNSDQVLLSLLEKTLVAITGRSESVGRPLLYGTTEEFLRIFGLNSLNELPKLREIEELMEEDAYSAERIEVVTVDPASDAEQIEAMVGAAGGEKDGEPEQSPDATPEESALTSDEIDTAPDEADVAADLDEIAGTIESDELLDLAEPGLEDTMELDDEIELDESPELDESRERGE